MRTLLLPLLVSSFALLACGDAPVGTSTESPDVTHDTDGEETIPSPVDDTGEPDVVEADAPETDAEEDADVIEEPDATPDAEQDADAETDPEDDTGATPDATLDADAETDPEDDTDATPDATLDATPDTEPDVRPGGCSARCPRGTYCAPPEFGMCGLDASLGTCERIPIECSRTSDPVCGCDGIDYVNPCRAAMTGIAVDYRGECVAGCVTNATCGRSEYCMFESGCTGMGECTPTPVACEDIWDPVCGCDGLTYGNECEAATARVNVAAEGECSDTGCRDDSGCARGSFCHYEECTAPGLCHRRPEAGCEPTEAPVCGCDGTTYLNECEAATVGESVRSEGACAGDCLTNEECGRRDYCIKTDGCDSLGVCGPRPGICPGIFDPVCGCDGRTYSNSCEASASGVNVKTVGECPPDPDE
jgi:hypothetical protein